MPHMKIARSWRSVPVEGGKCRISRHRIERERTTKKNRAMHFSTSCIVIAVSWHADGVLSRHKTSCTFPGLVAEQKEFAAFVFNNYVSVQSLSIFVI